MILFAVLLGAARAAEVPPPLPEGALLGTLGPPGWPAPDYTRGFAFSADGSALWTDAGALSAATGRPIPPPETGTGRLDAAGRYWGPALPDAARCAIGTPSALVPAGDHRTCPGGIVDGDRVLTREEAVLLGGDAAGGIVVWGDWTDGARVHVYERATGRDAATPAWVHHDIPAPSVSCAGSTCLFVELGGRVLRWQAGTFGVLASPDGQPAGAATPGADGTLWLLTGDHVLGLRGGSVACELPIRSLAGGSHLHLDPPGAHLALAPDGSLLAATWSGAGGVLAIDPGTCTVVAEPLPRGRIEPLGDGWRVTGSGADAVLGPDGERIAIVPHDPGRPPRGCSGIEPCDVAAASPDGAACACADRHRIWTGTPDGVGTVWTAETLPAPVGRALTAFTPSAAILLPDGRATVVLASATWRSADGFAADRVGFVLRPDGDDALLLHVPEDAVLATSPDGAVIAAAGWAGVGFYAADGGMPFAVDGDLPEAPAVAVFSPDGARLALGTAHAIVLYALAGAETRRIGAFDLGAGGVEGLVWGSRELLVRTRDAEILRLDPEVLAP